MWNNSKSAIWYTWGKISDCHVIEVEPCTGTIGTAGTEGGAGWGRRARGERGLCRGPWPPDPLQPQPGPVVEPSEVEDFQLNFTGGVPGPTSQNLLCEIKDSPSPVVLHVEAAFKGPALVIDVSALQFGLLRLGQRATNSIQIRNISQLPATWSMKESRVCLQERQEGAVGVLSTAELNPELDFPVPFRAARVRKKTGS
eukprot:bmy_22367T0